MPWWCSGLKWPRNARTVIVSSSVRPTKTWAPCRPVRPKKVAAKDVSAVLKPSRWYSITWVQRNVRPSRNVSTSPACIPARLPRFTDWSAQCIVKLEVTRIRVLICATNPGPRADPREQLLGEDGAVGDHEDVLLEALVRGHDVTDRDAAGRALDLGDDVAAHPARALRGVGGDDDLVDPRLERRERVPGRLHRPAVRDE